MKCPYCDSEFDINAVVQHDSEMISENEEMKWDTNAVSKWNESELSGMSIYSCKSCGAEIMTNSTTAASKCPYCDSPIVMSDSFSGDLKPNYVIPFKLNKEEAKTALNRYLNGKTLLPNVFREENHIDEIKGIYVPVWLFDAEANAKISFKAEKRRTWNDNSYNYIEISTYSAYRSGKVVFELVPVDGSEKMDDDLMESIEPYNFKEAVDFNMAYLSGYLADRYDVSSEQSIGRANDRIRKSTEDAFQETVTGYNSVMIEKSNIKLNNGKAKYALYPVWILNTTWNGEKYTFAMNGQTGKFVGDLPVDKIKAAKWFGAISVIGTAAVYALSYFLGL